MGRVVRVSQRTEDETVVTLIVRDGWFSCCLVTPRGFHSSLQWVWVGVTPFRFSTVSCPEILMISFHKGLELLLGPRRNRELGVSKEDPDEQVLCISKDRVHSLSTYPHPPHRYIHRHGGPCRVTKNTHPLLLSRLSHTNTHTECTLLHRCLVKTTLGTRGTRWSGP